MYSQVPIDDLPWRPFPSCLDFEMAEFILDAGLNNQMTDRLISLVGCCTSGVENFTIQDHKQLTKYWDLASAKSVKVIVIAK